MVTALGAVRVEDGRLAEQRTDVVATARTVIDQLEPDVVVTFGPDGAFGHPDHVTSCLATIEAVRDMAKPTRLLHARFPMRGPILVDLIVEWLTSHPQRFIGTAAFGHAFKLFADGSSMLGFAAERLLGPEHFVVAAHRNAEPAGQ